MNSDKERGYNWLFNDRKFSALILGVILVGTLAAITIQPQPATSSHPGVASTVFATPVEPIDVEARTSDVLVTVPYCSVTPGERRILSLPSSATIATLPDVTNATCAEQAIAEDAAGNIYVTQSYVTTAIAPQDGVTLIRTGPGGGAIGVYTITGIPAEPLDDTGFVRAAHYGLAVGLVGAGAVESLWVTTGADGGVYTVPLPLVAGGASVATAVPVAATLRATITDPNCPAVAGGEPVTEGLAFIEGHDVANADHPLFPGALLIAVEKCSFSPDSPFVDRIVGVDNVSFAVFLVDDLPGLGSNGPEMAVDVPSTLCAIQGGTGVYFGADFRSRGGDPDQTGSNPSFIDQFTPADFTGHSGWIMVPIEGGGVLIIDPAGPTTTEFEAAIRSPTNHEDADFADCPGGNVTRTPGYWQTHRDQTQLYWNNSVWSCAPDFDVDTYNKALGGMLSKIPKNTDGTNRSALDKARMQLAFHLVAAILNNEAFGSTPDSFGTSIADGIAAFCGDNITAIQTAHTNLGAFNESGDDLAFPDGFVNSAADPNAAKSDANLAFWNNLSSYTGLPP
jgi:hypothetical protein